MSVLPDFVDLCERIGMEVDPINHVQREFEHYYTEDYFNPINGDWISDDYLRIIDLTTQPGILSHKETDKLNRSIARLNGKYEYIGQRLGRLLTYYNGVAEQINYINSVDPNRSSVLAMRPDPLISVAFNK